MFSNDVSAAFEAAGWSPDRRVSTDQWVRDLTAEGFTLHPRAIALLENVGGLTVVPPKLPTNVYNPEKIFFDPLRASGEFDRVEYWERYLETHLSPIAELSGGAIVVIAEDGRIFTCWDVVLWWDGDSFEDAVENTLVAAHRRPRELATITD